MDDTTPGSLADGARDLEPSPFIRARIIGGLLLLALVFILGLIDAFRADFDFNPIEFALLLGTSLAMLGLEAGKWLLRG